MKWPEAMKNISRLVAIIATLLGYGVIAEAQEPGKIPWIGYPYLFSPLEGGHQIFFLSRWERVRVRAVTLEC